MGRRRSSAGVCPLCLWSVDSHDWAPSYPATMCCGAFVRPLPLLVCMLVGLNLAVPCHQISGGMVAGHLSASGHGGRHHDASVGHSQSNRESNTVRPSSPAPASHSPGSFPCDQHHPCKPTLAPDVFFPNRVCLMCCTDPVLGWCIVWGAGSACAPSRATARSCWPA